MQAVAVTHWRLLFVTAQNRLHCTSVAGKKDWFYNLTKHTRNNEEINLEDSTILYITI